VDIRFYLPSPLGSRVFHSILLSVKRTTALTVNNKDNLKWDKLSPETRRHYESQGWIASEWNNDGNIYDIDWDRNSDGPKKLGIRNMLCPLPHKTSHGQNSVSASEVLLSILVSTKKIGLLNR